MPITLDDPNICRTAMATLLSASEELDAATKPRLLVISTTGITRGPRDVPILYVPLYRWLLDSPHLDKRIMEQLIWDQKDMSEDQRVIGDFAIVRPTLLMDGKGIGVENVRYGLESKPALGYTIDRKDVGNWLFEKGVKSVKLGKHKDQAIILTC